MTAPVVHLLAQWDEIPLCLAAEAFGAAMAELGAPHVDGECVLAECPCRLLVPLAGDVAP
jgi:hypothetical protein